MEKGEKGQRRKKNL